MKLNTLWPNNNHPAAECNFFTGTDSGCVCKTSRSTGIGLGRWAFLSRSPGGTLRLGSATPAVCFGSVIAPCLATNGHGSNEIKDFDLITSELLAHVIRQP